MSTEDFSQVVAAEQNWQQQRRQAAGVNTEQTTIGVAFSGGGIRSACFHLGFLQALIETKSLQQVDYLSTVSGGGYMGGCLQWLKRHAASADNDTLFSQPVAGSTVLDWLRAHGKYLVDGNSVNNLTLAAALLASSLFNLMIILPLMLSAIWLAGLPHSNLPWPAHWHLPGAEVIVGHSGYLLLLFFSLACFLLFLLSVPTMALWRQATNGRDIHHSFKARRFMGRLLQLSVVAALIGVLPLVAQFGSMVVSSAGIKGFDDVANHANYLIPLAGGLASFRGARGRPQFAWIGLTLSLFGLAAFGYHLIAHTELMGSVWFWAWLSFAVIIAALASINRTSMHSYYLAQLCTAFFVKFACAAKLSEKSADQSTHNQSSADINLVELTPANGTPFPIINTTLNTASSNDRLQRERFGTSFSLTPLHCGAPLTGFAPTAEFQAGRLTLGQAITSSGAAVDPDTAQTSNRSLSFIMALLNFRLGYWVKHPRLAGKKVDHMPYWLIACEMFGVGLNSECDNLHLTDGGHFENLGVYELLRREVPLILSGDAGADPNTSLSDLGILLQRAQADFNCNIDIDTSAMTEIADSFHRSSFAVGKIRYASGKVGCLIFVKALLCRDASALVKTFATTDPSFPNDSTANQFYNEQHFDAYRNLGRDNLLSVFKQFEAQTLDDLFTKVQA